MKSIIIAATLPIMLGGCLQLSNAQINDVAVAVCDAAIAEASAQSNSTSTAVKAAVLAVGAVCANPTSTAAQINSARGQLKSAIAAAKS